MQGGGLSPVGNRLPGQNGGGCGFCCSEAGEVRSGKREAVCLSQEGEQWRRQSQSKEGGHSLEWMSEGRSWREKSDQDTRAVTPQWLKGQDHHGCLRKGQALLRSLTPG